VVIGLFRLRSVFLFEAKGPQYNKSTVDDKKAHAGTKCTPSKSTRKSQKEDRRTVKAELENLAECYVLLAEKTQRNSWRRPQTADK
jgi:hypothetical protein